MEVSVLNIKTMGKVIKFKIRIVDIPEFKVLQDILLCLKEIYSIGACLLTCFLKKPGVILSGL